MFAVRSGSAPEARYDRQYFDPLIQRDRTSEVQDQHEEVLGELEHLVAGRMMLDVGCGAGAFGGLAKQRGWDVLGVDGSGEALAFASEVFRLKVEKVDLNSCRFPEASYDVVRAFHCLEHLDNPGDALDACAGALVSGGILLLGLPRYSLLQVRTHQALHQAGLARFPFDFGLPDHVAYFSDRTLVRALRQRGLEVERVWHSAPRSLADLGTRLEAGGGARRFLGSVMRSMRSPLDAVRWHAHMNVIARRP